MKEELSDYRAIPGLPKEPKIMARYARIVTIGSMGSLVLAILELQVGVLEWHGNSMGYYPMVFGLNDEHRTPPGHSTMVLLMLF